MSLRLVPRPAQTLHLRTLGCDEVPQEIRDDISKAALRPAVGSDTVPGLWGIDIHVEVPRVDYEKLSSLSSRRDAGTGVADGAREDG